VAARRLHARGQDEEKDADISALATLCEDDDKVLRYLKLFCRL
jgi:hypothetical protein